jgi:hypothetical protein
MTDFIAALGDHLEAIAREEEGRAGPPRADQADSDPDSP